MTWARRHHVQVKSPRGRSANGDAARDLLAYDARNVAPSTRVSINRGNFENYPSSVAFFSLFKS